MYGLDLIQKDAPAAALVDYDALNERRADLIMRGDYREIKDAHNLYGWIPSRLGYCNRAAGKLHEIVASLGIALMGNVLEVCCAPGGMLQYLENQEHVTPFYSVYRGDNALRLSIETTATRIRPNHAHDFTRPEVVDSYRDHADNIAVIISDIGLEYEDLDEDGIDFFHTRLARIYINFATVARLCLSAGGTFIMKVQDPFHPIILDAVTRAFAQYDC